MFALGIMGSPRKKGNTAALLSAFMDELGRRGASTLTINVSEKKILPCVGCTYCEEHGHCFQKDDDMAKEIYGLLRNADVVVVATPMYFYSAPSQLKALIDRSQAMWSRKYRLNLKDPKAEHRAGFLLAQGATKGKNLFEGINLTARYFFDAVSAKFSGSLGYRRIENPGDMDKQEGLSDDIVAEVDKIGGMFSRKRVLFACRENSCRSQMASAFASILAGDRIDAQSAGSAPADSVNPDMVSAMAERGVDMAFRSPRSIEDLVPVMRPELVVTMGCGEECPYIPGAEIVDWNIEDPAGKPMDVMRKVRDEIEERVADLVSELS